MGNQVHSIHLPDSFLFLKGALLWTTGGLLCKQPLHWLSGTAYLLVFRKPSARGGGEAKKSATRRKSRKVAQLSWLEEALVAQSCLTLCDPTECRPPGSSVHGILQARKLDWVAIPFSRRSFWPRDWTWVSCVTDRFFTLWGKEEEEWTKL